MDLHELFFEKHPNAMLIYDIETLQIIKVNQSAIDNYGYSKDEFCELTIEDLRPREVAPKFRDELADIGQKSQVFSRGTYKHLTKNGEIRHVQVTAQNYEFEGNQACVVHIHDLTEIIDVKDKYKDTLEELKH
jgi:PAS domain S-box-containing protein